MKFIVFACLLALAVARPDSGYAAPGGRSSDPIEIIKDERVAPEDGAYSFNFETENGIVVSQYGSPLDIEENPTGKQGSVQFTLPNGEEFSLSFVADENGYQPDSAFLPVAPAFPHPIPDFVREQIDKAAREDAEAARSGPKASYD